MKDREEYISILEQDNAELKKQVEQYQQELEKADSITQSCIFNGKKESNINFCMNVDGIKEEIVNQLKSVEQEYTFMTDDERKFKGTIKKKYLWIKYYWKKKGKKYKRFFKHSKEVAIVFEGKVIK